MSDREWIKARLFVWFTLCLICHGVICFGQGMTFAPIKLDESLRTFLKTQLKNPDLTTRVTSASVDVGDGAREILAYVSGNGWCGSGGCHLLILMKEGSSYKMIGRVTIVHPPIRLIDTKSHGLPIIGVLVAGGGITPGYESMLSFDGQRYPSNPTMPPAQRNHGVPVGRVAISNEDTGESLFR